jgi:hypothetical protein
VQSRQRNSDITVHPNSSSSSSAAAADVSLLEPVRWQVELLRNKHKFTDAQEQLAQQALGKLAAAVCYSGVSWF